MQIIYKNNDSGDLVLICRDLEQGIAFVEEWSNDKEESDYSLCDTKTSCAIELVICGNKDWTKL